MSAAKELSVLPPAVLRGALRRAEKRVEAENLRMDIRRMQKRLYEIEEGRDTPEVEHKEVVVDGYPRGVKRFTIDVDSSSDDGEGRETTHDRNQPIAKVQKKVRRVYPEPATSDSSLRFGKGGEQGREGDFRAGTSKGPASFQRYGRSGGKYSY